MKKDVTKHKNQEKKRVVGFKVLENECIWMKAGVVNFRLCDNDYDCQSCPFDLGMRKAMGMSGGSERKNVSPAWVEKLKKQYRGASRPCRHALTGRIDAPKICTMNYECYHCPFDQMLDEFDFDHFREAVYCKNVSGFRVAEGYYYHMGHSWARFEHGGYVRVGLDDFVNRIFGTIDDMVLPPLGSDLKQNEVGWSFARNKHRAGVLSPVTGMVLAINHRAETQPEIVGEDPYQLGWLFIIEPERPKQNLKGLFFGDESVHWMEQEVKTLMGLLGPRYESLSAMGGHLVDGMLDKIPELAWDALVRTFLHTEEATGKK
ncbi:MAG: glycine cleavage system protein H [Deltaproteobacteria bacterium]|nr:glycine cleavage system protein H [Deltaproteobacteria bacterium]MBW2137972.1 glycine cleavage system protein H [Deltaproteobacteria bacterium]